MALARLGLPPELERFEEMLEHPHIEQAFRQDIVFEVLATDPDEEALSVQWIEKGKVIGTGLVFTTSGLAPGKHQITVRAIDPHGAAAEANLTVEVEEAGGLPGPSASLAIVTFAVTHAALRAERAAMEAGFAVRMIPVPRGISSDCNMGMEAPVDEMERLRSLFASEGIECDLVRWRE